MRELRPGWTTAEKSAGAIGADPVSETTIDETISTFCSPMSEVVTPSKTAQRIPGTPLRVVMTRKPFDDVITLNWEGNSEELEFEEAKAWFIARGAEPEPLEKALIHVWSFYKGGFTIHKPIEETIEQALRGMAQDAE